MHGCFQGIFGHDPYAEHNSQQMRVVPFINAIWWKILSWRGIVAPDLLPHQCRYLCLQSVTCKAYNYNATMKTCTRFTSPCPKAFSDPDMAFMVLRETPVNQCYEWVLYTGDPVHERMIQTDNDWLIVSRLKVYGNDVVCYFTGVSNTCWATLVTTEYSTRQGHQCERLRVVEGCTITWVSYTAGEPLPPNAVIGGVLANGDVPYVVKFDCCVYSNIMINIVGYYIEALLLQSVATQEHAMQPPWWWWSWFNTRVIKFRGWKFLTA